MPSRCKNDYLLCQLFNLSCHSVVSVPKTSPAQVPFSAQERPQRKWLNFTEQKEVDLWDCFALWDSMQALWLYWPYQLTWAMLNLRVIEKHTLMRLMLATFKLVGPVPHTAVGLATLTVQVCLPAPAYLNVLLKIDILESTLLFMTILSLLIIN